MREIKFRLYYQKVTTNEYIVVDEYTIEELGSNYDKQKNVFIGTLRKFTKGD